jgi:hypothetical protein
MKRESSQVLIRCCSSCRYVSSGPLGLGFGATGFDSDIQTYYIIIYDICDVYLSPIFKSKISNSGELNFWFVLQLPFFSHFAWPRPWPKLPQSRRPGQRGGSLSAGERHHCRGTVMGIYEPLENYGTKWFHLQKWEAVDQQSLRYTVVLIMYIDPPLYYYSWIYIFQAPQQPNLSHLSPN